ncbi:hypothetical protein EST38_g5418 [Candolleomyces aberdarensis]|uniref:Uncharacterized protein n=1 Tax=Candolleomyces aberdarensis TaxID=2316362 RepID=A0A4Q2DMB8_9AGAR|nr:hypothetical protein EST38_g5418 [Candolleomyces aberdarensis]
MSDSFKQAPAGITWEIPCPQRYARGGVNWLQLMTVLFDGELMTGFRVMHSLVLSKDEWLSVLKLSTRWLFNDLRTMAIEELSWLNLDPIERIQLGKEFNVEAWLLSGCCDLVSRESVISIEDAEKISWKVAINLYIIRDGVKTDPLAGAHAIDDQVRNAFSTDFEQIKSSQSMYLTADEKLREVQEEEERKREVENRKKEAEELASLEAESHRLEALAAEEEKRIAELALELENRRRQLHSFGTTPTTPYARIPEVPKPQPSADSSSQTAILANASASAPCGEEDNGETIFSGTRVAHAEPRATALEALSSAEDTKAIDIEEAKVAGAAEQTEEEAKSPATMESPLPSDFEQTPTPPAKSRPRQKKKSSSPTWPPVLATTSDNSLPPTPFGQKTDSSKALRQLTSLWQ